MAAKKSTAKKSAAKSEKSAVPGADGKLTRAVWHKGKMYDPKNKGDVAAFAKLMANDKKAAEQAEKLQKKKVVKGFGTTQGEDDAEDTSDAPVGGGLEGSEEPPEDEE